MAGQSKRRNKSTTSKPKLPSDPKTPKLTGGPLSRKRGEYKSHKGGTSKVGGPKDTRGPTRGLRELGRKRMASKIKWPD